MAGTDKTKNQVLGPAPIAVLVNPQLGENIGSDARVGRTLEFLTQEMGREWNTTGAKANEADISRLVVEAKSELDKLREQLANIE